MTNLKHPSNTTVYFVNYGRLESMAYSANEMLEIFGEANIAALARGERVVVKHRLGDATYVSGDALAALALTEK